jgi:SAM-dependent methyltransferase
MHDNPAINRAYWNAIADEYQSVTHISLDDFHFAPLLPNDRALGILPPITPGMTCLEVGSGAAQNSIYLARQGAICTAIDVADDQLRHARELATTAGIDLQTTRATMEGLAAAVPGTFDLVHSTFALPFSDDPCLAIQQMAAKVAPGGTLLIACQHPLAFSEWLETEEDGFGAFTLDYFSPPADARLTAEGHVISQSWPVGVVANWIADTGLTNLRIWEPPAAHLDTVTPDAAAQQMPYWSDDWLTLYDQYRATPFSVIYRATARLSH